MIRHGLGTTRRAFLAGAAATIAGRLCAASAQSPETGLRRIAFGSCADQTRPQPIWEAVLAARPDLFIFAGDNVYGDVRSDDLRELRAAYAQAREIPGLGRLRAGVPVLATWDDHDYGRNDAGAEFGFKRQSQELFAEFWDLPADDPRRRQEGIYFAAAFGPPGQRVQVVLLDTRYFRSPLQTYEGYAPGRGPYRPDPDPGKTMLGPAQWSWLAERLREPAELRLIVSSIQVVAEGHVAERWGNLPLERQRLYDLIGEAGANGVVFLSGDRHFGAIYEERDGTPYPLVEITASGINRSFRGVSEPGPNRVEGPFDEPNFGLIDIDWSGGRVELSLRDGEGAERLRRAVSLRDLAA